LEFKFFPESSRSRSERRVNAAMSCHPTQSYMDFDFDYFDNVDGVIGYKGYSYDERFKAVAENMIDHYGLKDGSKVVEIGCAKGFLLVEFWKRGIDIQGYDLSRYAIDNCIEDISRFLTQLDVTKGLPLADQAVDLLIAKEVIPHIASSKVPYILNEIERVSKQAFVEIQCIEFEEDRDMFLEWDPTHQTVLTKQNWLDLIASNAPSLDYSFRFLV
jgi:cyclopropane fatty-acyl-phospholipid synthase-like methyltransferase